MTISQKKKILEKIVQLESDIDELKRVRMELATSGYSSASLSSSGGSKSYTRMDIGSVNKVICMMLEELEQYKSMLSSGSALSIPHTIKTVYSGGVSL